MIEMVPSAVEVAAPLAADELAVLKVLVETHQRVVSRRELARRAGLSDQSERRCDALLVGLRRRSAPIRSAPSATAARVEPNTLDAARALIDEH